ncbi:MAG: ribose-phosphate pyrophosphokinase [Alphaproteobacteria bacterium]|nr:ribose-phosphate pyrophosphokinase [Alphaproteobacteria bacterium]
MAEQDARRAPLKLVACDAARDTAGRVAEILDAPLVGSREVWFACGEGKFILQENVRGDDLYIFQSPIYKGGDSDRSVYDRFVMLLHAVEAAALSDAEYITAVVPYYPGARQDKQKGRTREGISAGLFARCLQEAGATRVVCVDIHNLAVAGMFDPYRCRLENVFLTHRFAKWLRRRGLCGDIVASPDLGGMERARDYAAELSVGIVGLSKERDYTTENTVLRSTLIGDVAGKDVLLVDDMVDTGGSVVAAVDELRRAGAGNVTVACTHPIMSDPAWQRLSELHDRAHAAGWRFRMVGTSAIRHPDTPHWYLEYPIEPLLADVIDHINRRGSVTGVQQGDDPE